MFGTDCWGGYAELVRVPARAVIALREEAEFIAAAAAQCVVSTAWHMVFRLALIRAGETVLVPSASGGVAGAAVQCAKIAGARVIATVGDPAKVPKVLELGADEAFSYREIAVREASPSRTAAAAWTRSSTPWAASCLAIISARWLPTDAWRRAGRTAARW